MKWIAISVVVAGILLLLSNGSSAGRILGVFPFASKSHWAFGSSVLKVLAEAGHEVTVLSPFVMANTNATTYTSIELVEVADLFKKMATDMDFLHWSMKLPLVDLVKIVALGRLLVPTVMESKGVKALLADKSQQFDLVMVEPFATDALFGFGEHFNAPVITVFPSVASRLVNSLVGNPEDPSYVPSLYLPFTPQMTLSQRVINYFVAIVEFCILEGVSVPSQSNMHHKYFPNNKKSLREVIREDVAIAFINTHFSLTYPRPYVPNVIEIGGINIDRNIGELPAEFNNFLDNAKEGVVLFSMGSILQASDLQEEQREVLISAFGKLKQKVIWRFNLPDESKLPKNILPKEWLPQKEILAHPNVKAFITHGGMLGTTESVYHGKPMIGMPCFGDQKLNIARAVKQGYAIKLDLDNLTEGDLISALEEIIDNPQYAERAQVLSTIFKDRPMTPQESVLYWSEYVMRYKGAKHMRVEAQNMNLIAYHGLDVLVILMLAALLFVVVPLYLLVKWVFGKMCKSSKVCQKGEGKLKSS